MRVGKQIQNLVLICCILAIAIFWFSSEFHESVRAFRSFQASYSEITKPCSCQKRPVLFAEEELMDTVSSVLENVECRNRHEEGFLRHLELLFFAYLVFAAAQLKRFRGEVYQFSERPTCELVRILNFLRNADGRKKFFVYS